MKPSQAWALVFVFQGSDYSNLTRTQLVPTSCVEGVVAKATAEGHLCGVWDVHVFVPDTINEPDLLNQFQSFPGFEPPK